MTEKKVQQAGHAEQVARRAFMKKAAMGAALAVPAIESLTKSDILVKSALAATVQHFVVTAEIVGGAGGGTVNPTQQTYPQGATAFVQVTPWPLFAWAAVVIDGGGPTPPTAQQLLAGGVTFPNISANHTVQVSFAS